MMTNLKDDAVLPGRDELTPNSHLCAWEWTKWLNSAPIFDRTRILSATADHLHNLWRSGFDLARFPPILWRFTLNDRGLELDLPDTYLKPMTRSHSVDQIIVILSGWYIYGRRHFRTMDLLRFLKAFLAKEPVDHSRFACLLREIDTASKKLKRLQFQQSGSSISNHAQSD